MTVPSWESILGKTANWGTLLLGAGVLLSVLAGKLAEKAPEQRRETVKLILKFAGLALAITGALRIFNYIR